MKPYSTEIHIYRVRKGFLSYCFNHPYKYRSHVMTDI